MKTVCDNHPEKSSKASCFICSKSICEDCISIIAGKAYCKSCGYGIISEAEILYLKRIYQTIKDKKKLDISKDKRHYQRIHIVRSIEIYDEETQKNIRGIMIDISVGDISILLDEQLSLKDKVRLNFILTDEFQFKNIQGGVIRVEKVGEKYHIGIILMNLGENKEKVENFVMGRLKKKYIREDVSYV